MQLLLYKQEVGVFSLVASAAATAIQTVMILLCASTREGFMCMYMYNFVPDKHMHQSLNFLGMNACSNL